MHGKGSDISAENAENELKGACVDDLWCNDERQSACVDLWCNDEVGRWKCKGEMLK